MLTKPDLLQGLVTYWCRHLIINETARLMWDQTKAAFNQAVAVLFTMSLTILVQPPVSGRRTARDRPTQFIILLLVVLIITYPGKQESTIPGLNSSVNKIYYPGAPRALWTTKPFCKACTPNQGKKRQYTRNSHYRVENAVVEPSTVTIDTHPLEPCFLILSVSAFCFSSLTLARTTSLKIAPFAARLRRPLGLSLVPSPRD